MWKYAYILYLMLYECKQKNPLKITGGHWILFNLSVCTCQIGYVRNNARIWERNEICRYKVLISGWMECCQLPSSSTEDFLKIYLPFCQVSNKIAYIPTYHKMSNPSRDTMKCACNKPYVCTVNLSENPISCFDYFRMNTCFSYFPLLSFSLGIIFWA